MEKIVAALNALGVEQYVITEKHTDSLEAFYVKKNLDLTRRADTTVRTVRVFRPFEKDGERMLGNSEATIRPGMSEEEIRTALAGAWYAAQFVANPWYPLPKGVQAPPKADTGGFGGKSLAENMKAVAQALFAEDTAQDVFLNSAEIFAVKRSRRVINSRGVDVSWDACEVRGEYVCQCPAPQDVETYHQFCCREPSPEALRAEVRHALAMTKARAQAVTVPKTGTYALVLDREQVGTLLSYYVDRSNSGMI